MLCTPPHCIKDVYTPQGPSPGLSTVATLCAASTERIAHGPPLGGES
jgi:hypothetical protein